jgi:hypothetical protein
MGSENTSLREGLGRKTAPMETAIVGMAASLTKQ